MAQPSPAVVLVCPKCGRKYGSDPGKIAVKCEDDGTALVLPENDSGATMAFGMDTVAPPAPPKAPAADGATLDFGSATPSMMPTAAPAPSHQERPSVLSMLQSTADAASPSAAPATKYAISGKLGQGGVGEVLLVEDRDLERSVAMKRLLPQPGGTVAEDTLTASCARPRPPASSSTPTSCPSTTSASTARANSTSR